MSLRKIAFLIICITLGFVSCNNDDDGFVAPEPIDVREKYVTDSTDISNYLKTHYYNSADFIGSVFSVNNIVIGEVEENMNVPAGNSLLMDDVEIKSYDLGEITYHYYILRINQGQGINSPSFSDNILISYEGYRILDDFVFDSRLNPNPTHLDLTTLIRGWQLVLPEFKTASSISDNGDGTFLFEGSGLGMMFIPSGLAYLFTDNSLQLNPLAFRFELIKSFENDHDEDGIPSYLEELTGDNLFFVATTNGGDDDDTDGDGTPDYFDADDDNDGILTINEIEINFVEASSKEEVLNTPLESDQVLTNFIEELKNEMGDVIGYKGKIITFIDTDGDGKPNYLDAE